MTDFAVSEPDVLTNGAALHHDKIKDEPASYDYEEINIKEELIDDEQHGNFNAEPSSSRFFPLTCGSCQENFKDAQLLNMHMNEYHPRDVIKTEPDVVDAAPERQLNNLQNKRLCLDTIARRRSPLQGSGRIACDFCGMKYKNIDNLMKHQRKTKCTQQEQIQSMHCGTCGISFTSRINLSRHQARTGCVQNGDNASSEDTDVEQFPALKSETVAKRFPHRFYCDTCGLSYKNRSNLIRHQKKSGCRQKKRRPVTHAETNDENARIDVEPFIKVEETAGEAYSQSDLPYEHCSMPFSGTALSQEESVKDYLQQNKAKSIPNPNDDVQPAAGQDFINVSSSPRPAGLAESTKHEKQAEHMKPEIICDICNRSFENIKRLYAHADAHDRVPAVLQDDVDFLKCKFCLKQFSEHTERREHEATHTGDKKPYKCLHCNKVFVRSRNLMQHIRIHTGELPFRCETCSKVFRDRRYLRRHIDRHHLLVERLACDLCDVKVYDKVQLALHRRTHIEGRTFACTSCGKTREIAEQKPFFKHDESDTDGSENLDRDDSRSAQQLDLHCDLCNRRFKDKEIFYSHADTHEKIPEALKDDADYLKCKYCYKEFSVLAERKTHETTHRRKRPYQCPQCKLRFVSNLSRKIHMRTHTEDPVLQCDECLKTFKDKSGLKRHIKRKHLKIRKVGCDLCDRKFFDRVELALHMLSHIKKENYVCESCRK